MNFSSKNNKIKMYNILSEMTFIDECCDGWLEEEVEGDLRGGPEGDLGQFVVCQVTFSAPLF